MSMAKPDDDKKVVQLPGLRSEATDPAFGASIQRAGGHARPANEQVPGLISRILVDETLPFYVATLDGTVIHLNEHYGTLDKSLGESCLAPGKSKAAGLGRSLSLKPVIEDVMASGTTARAEEIINVSGRDRIFLGRHIPVRNDLGEIIAVAGTYEDVTVQVRGVEEANKTQARFQDFARASSDWFFECDADMRINSLSERFTAIVGRPASLFLGARFQQFGRFEPNLEGRCEGEQAIKVRKAFREQLFIITEPSGGELMFHLSGVPVFDRHSGDFRGYRGVGMEVTARYRQAGEAASIRENLETLLTELTRKNMALDEATEQATTALKAKNEFLAAMSHELRTPLNAIIGFAEAFEHETFGPLENAYMSYASDIRKSGQHLLGLINDILDVAVIESGGLSLQLDDLMMESIINKAVQMNVEAAKAKKLNIEGLFVETDHFIHADDRRTTQILVNLLSNAIKFTPEGGRIGLELSEDRENKLVLITVWDTGIGIADSHLAQVFDKFHQVTDHIYSRKQEGTGLGLHISRELARRMGGNLTVTSDEGHGSRFTVSLPTAKGNVDDSNFI